MEEYTFNSDNTEVNETNEVTEEIITPEYEPVAPKATKKKRRSASRALLSLGALLLVICISVSSGFIGAYFMVENRIDELELYYNQIASLEAEETQNDGGKLVNNDKPNLPSSDGKSHFDSIAAAQSASAKAEALARIATKTANGGYAAVATAVKDTVVEISTEMAAGSSYFQQFIQSGAGSGVVISDDGYIITNNHVIEGATKITVRLTSGDEYSAELIGTDAQADIAVIKISPANKLAYAVIGNSDTILVGEEVLAIGNPLGKLGGSVTNGIISALDRELTIDGQTMRLLQTNAAINPGNSGGGLFNMKGELIAVVNAKSSGTGIEGLGFAIPINYAYEIASELLTNGYVSGRPALGISYIEIVNYMDLMRYGVNAYGIYVYDGGVTDLKNGDRIISIDEYEVSDTSTLRNAINQFKVGDTVELMVARGGKFTKINVTLTESKPVESETPKLQINK